MRSRLLAPTFYLAAPLTTVALLFFAPLAIMTRQSLAADRGGFTLEHFERFFGDAFYGAALVVTIATALLVVAIAIVVSYPVAYVYWRSSRLARSIMLVGLLAPFYVNIVAKVFGWMVLFEPLGLSPGYTAVVLVSVHRCLPFVVLLLAGAMATIDDALLEAARVCGAPPGHVVRTVIFPLSMPGVVAAGIVGFSLTLAGFVIPLLLGGGARGQFVPVLMYQSITVAQNWPFGAAMGVVLLAASLATMVAGGRLVRSLRSGRLLREDLVQ